MNKLKSIILIVAMGLFSAPALAGTCNLSLVDSLPQTSGSIGALPPNLPGQTAPGFITHIEATGGPSISFTYTPTSGSPVTTSINFGALSGVSCISQQTGGWGWNPATDRVSSITFNNVFGTSNSVLIINGVTPPSNIINCTGLQMSGGWNGISGGPSLSMISTGPDPQTVTFGGYNISTGSNLVFPRQATGSCNTTRTSLTTDNVNNAVFHVHGSTGMSNVQYYVDNVLIGSASTIPFDFSTNAISIGVHALKAVTTFPLGTVWSTSNVLYAPIKVSAGANFACAITQGGRASCWGRNNYGQLGAGSTAASSNVPLEVQALGGFLYTSIVDISAGLEAACAVNYNGGVICWGKNTNGILGVAPGTLSYSNTPVQVIPSGSGVKNVRVGGQHACALYNNGTVSCWGNGQYGQLGNSSFTATNITPSTSVFTLATAIEFSRDTTYVLTSDGQVWATGRDDYGQLANGLPLANISFPESITGLPTTAIYASLYGACAKMAGSYRCWGANGSGSVGLGTTVTPITTPTIATAWSGYNILSMSGGDETMCALYSLSGAMKIGCIGYNAYGQLGNGTISSSVLSPVIPTGYTSNSVQVSGSYFNVCAFVNGHVKCAGDNTYGQIGDPAASNPQTTPYTVLGL